jgi:gamma-tubulin complex component 5
MYHSILLSFIKRATVLRFLRAFVTSVYDNISQQPSEGMHAQPTSRVFQAFGAGVGSYLQDFDSWCAAKEQSLCRARGGYSPTLIVSLLNLDHETERHVGCTFDILRDVLYALHSCRPPHVVAREVSSSFDFTSVAPSIISMTLLDALLSSVQLARSAYGDHQAAKTLMDIFTRSVEPLWASIGIWLKLGMSLNDSIAQDDVPSNAVGPDAEFFLRRRDVQLGSADFWLKGYTVRLHRYSGVFVEEDDDTEDTLNGGDVGVHTVPEFLQLVASDILAAGKSVGFLRALQVDDFFGDSTNDEYEWMRDWPSFRSLIGSDSLIISTPTSPNSSTPPPPNQPILEAVSRLSQESSNLESPNASDDADEGPWASSPSVPSDAPSHRPLHSSDNPLLSADALASLIQERVKPWCRLANSRLHRVLVVDCELWRHLGCMEDLFFTRRGDALTHFCDILFDRVSCF